MQANRYVPQLTPKEEQEEEDAAYVRALQLTAGTVLAMVLKVALEPDLFEVIVTAGPGNAMSPEEIAARLPTQNPQAPIWVDRILRLLAANSIVGCTVESGFDGRLSRKYSMAPISKFFTKSHDSSFASVVWLGTDKVYMDVR
ncbi:caffeic acid 3-O-methyltransferase-like [Musa acuminata AAA Group]|uniref:caffeic acid 3-O-methyltransferase-like n=1 Tax=Musa acuminata AAA Group TaxID=214697 RepID=UPI0031DA7E9A